MWHPAALNTYYVTESLDPTIVWPPVRLQGFWKFRFIMCTPGTSLTMVTVSVCFAKKCMYPLRILVQLGKLGATYVQLIIPLLLPSLFDLHLITMMYQNFFCEYSPNRCPWYAFLPLCWCLVTTAADQRALRPSFEDSRSDTLANLRFLSPRTAFPDTAHSKNSLLVCSLEPLWNGIKAKPNWCH